MVSLVSVFLLGVGGVVAAGMALLVAFQEKLVYILEMPGLTRSYAITPSRICLVYSDVWLTSSDGVCLHAWFIKLSHHCRAVLKKRGFVNFHQPRVDRMFRCIPYHLYRVKHKNKSVIFLCSLFHTTKVQLFSFFRKMRETLLIVLKQFILCYKNCSAMFSCFLTEVMELVMDCLHNKAALDHLLPRLDIDTSRIFVFGRSLGGAVGAVLTENNPDTVAALILENTFTSILDMAGRLLPFLKLFIGKSSKGPKVLNFLVRSPWSTIDVITEINQPILFLSGLQDEMVPPSHMEMLYAKATAHNKQCLLVEFPTGKHMDTWSTGGDRYWTTIQEFFKRTVPEGRK